MMTNTFEGPPHPGDVYDTFPKYLKAQLSFGGFIFGVSTPTFKIYNQILKYSFSDDFRVLTRFDFNWVEAQSVRLQSKPSQIKSNPGLVASLLQHWTFFYNLNLLL